jgi:hypothetical protein
LPDHPGYSDYKVTTFPDLSLEGGEEICYYCWAGGGDDAFRMELDAIKGEGGVAKGHEVAVGIGGCGYQASGEGSAIYNP